MIHATDAHDASTATVAGIVTGAVTWIEWAGGIGSKMLAAGLVALATGFCYKAGTWAWHRLITRFSRSTRGDE